MTFVWHPRRVVTWASVAALAIVGAASAAVLVWVARTRQPVVPISITNLDMGDVWARDSFSWPVYLTNCSNRDIYVEELEASCHCLRVDPRSFVIPARGSTQVVLTISLRLGNPTEPAHKPHPFSVAIVPVVKGQGPQGRFVLRGMVRNPIAFSVREVFFPEEDAAGPSQDGRRKVVSFDSTVPLKSVDVVSQPPHVTAVVTRDSAAGGTIAIAPAADLPAGPFQCDLVVSGVSESGERLPAVRLPVAGVVTRDIYLAPATLSFSPRPVGSEMDASILIASRTQSRFSVESVTASSKEVFIHPTNLPSANGQTYAIGVRVLAVGVQSETVQFVVSSGSLGRQRIRIPVNYVGLPAEVQR